jgi:hypothetical protein
MNVTGLDPEWLRQPLSITSKRKGQKATIIHWCMKLLGFRPPRRERQQRGGVYDRRESDKVNDSG